jgi:hypothetical protein
LPLITFTPLYGTLFFGQASLLLLIGTVGLFLLRRSFTISLIGGLLFSIALIKPHLFLLLSLAGVLFGKREQVLPILIGSLLGAASLIATAIIILPSCIEQYLAVMQTPPILFRTPTVGSFLQAFLDSHSTTIRFIPTLTIAISLVALRLLFFTGSRTLTPIHLSVLFPLSLTFSPYGWIYDQVVFLPVFAFVLWRVRNIMLSSALVVAHLAVALSPNEWGQEKGIITNLVYLSVGLFMYRSNLRGAGVAPS